MTNLLFITTYTGIGGGESLTLNLMNALDKARFCLHLLTPHTGKFPTAAAALGVQTHTMPFRGTSTIFLPLLWAHFPIASKLRTFLRKQTIHAVISDYHSLPFIVPAARSLNVPVIWNAMGWWFPIYAWQRRFFSRQVSRIVAVSSAVKEKLLGSPPKLPPELIQVRIPGVDTSQHYPEAVSGAPVRAHMQISAETPLVAMIARFQDVKGHDDFLDAAKLIRRAVPSVRFAVAGENVFAVSKDEAYKQRILARVRDDAELRDCVTFLGFWHDSREVIAASDVMVCSSWFESLSMVALESMAMARPIVSTRVGGPSETVLDGETGYLVPPRDPAALAERVVALLHSPEQRKAMGARGAAHVRQNFSAARYAADISALIDSALCPKT
ncbi:MAG: glycosyltransferase family 4 protein [Anaerolineae bacterium]|nr:glycosyltransferase family 4 protein [Anaerolineae bacterium]MDW8300198.1 glycosyltransferase family 4 protein [Anaerolineae bacterium]